MERLFYPYSALFMRTTYPRQALTIEKWGAFYNRSLSSRLIIRSQMQRIFQSLRKPQIIFGAILLFGLLAMTARNATDPDLWWHLRTGQWIIDTGHVPHSDPFSFTRTGRAWVSHEWLSEVLFYELWKRGGTAALIVFSAILTTAGFMLLYLRCPGKRHWAAAATALGAVASAPSFGVRPQMFTFTLASLLLWLLANGEDRPRLLWWIPPLFLLWLNLHAGFALCPALLLAYGIGLILEAALGETAWQQVRPIFMRVVVLLVACLALVPLNPSGAQLYRYPFDTIRSPGMRSYILEWFSPDFHEWLYRPLLLVWLLLLIALSRSRWQIKERLMVPLLFTSFAALDAVRHIPIFVLLAIPVIAAAIASATADRGERPELSSISSRFHPSFVGAVVILLAGFAVVRWTILARNEDAREAEQFPQKAVSFLRAGAYPQRVFAYYDWGGYTIWHLYPEYRVFVDGRADLYGDNLLQQFQTAVQLKNGWQDVLDKWNVEAVLVPPSCALAQALLLDPNWHPVFSDSKAIVLLRTRSGTGGSSAGAIRRLLK
jgi:hypothetical protein